MKSYNYFTIGESNEYGQPTVSQIPKGTIKIAINSTGTSTQDNVLYKNASYIGLTQANVNDTYIIEYENTKLKVLYVNPKGRYKQVFMVNYE